MGIPNSEFLFPNSIDFSRRGLVTDLDLDIIAPEAVPGIRVLGVLHERVDLVPIVRSVLEKLQPAAVAVELPTTLADAAAKAIDRLPKISVIVSEEPGEEALLWAVTPGDPLVEGMRWARARDTRIFLIDPDVRYRGRRHDPIPDPQVLHELGAEQYVELIRGIAGAAPHDDGDLLRERGMAHNIKQAAATTDGPILCIVGAAHADRLALQIDGPTAQPLARQQRSRVVIRHLHPDSLSAVLPDPPLAHATVEMLRQSTIPEAPDLQATVAPRIEVPYGPLTLITGGPTDRRTGREEAITAFAAHHASRPGPDGAPVVDRSKMTEVVWRLGAASYTEQTHTEPARWQKRLFLDFTHRHARVQGRLTPGLYGWVMGARGVGDDNLAWEIFDVARCYPYQGREAEIETAHIDGDLLDLGTRTVRFRRRFFRVKQRPLAVPVKTRPAPDDPGEWLRAFSGDSICSYPPEDVVVEDWGQHLKSRAVSVIRSETSRSEPFSTSMLDGLDLRETLLRHHEGRIWVREQGRDPGTAGAVVMIFDDGPEGGAYPYRMSWLGEHEQESDMAFYATDPMQQVVGPGIMRATYGGFMLTYPPGRLFDVWRDPDYANATSKSEVLLMAAIDYSTDRLVVHAAPGPPSSSIREYAAVRARRIVHIPLGSLSPTSLNRLRVVHILAGRDKREIAKDYLW